MHESVTLSNSTKSVQKKKHSWLTHKAKIVATRVSQEETLPLLLWLYMHDFLPMWLVVSICSAFAYLLFIYYFSVVKMKLMNMFSEFDSGFVYLQVFSLVTLCLVFLATI